MQAKRFYRLVVSLGVFLLGLFCLFPMRQTANAQSAAPQFLVTWQASKSYAPPGYPDKILPNNQSSITASFELISQGKVVNLGGQTVYWYLDDNLLGGGAGIQRMTFKPYGAAPNVQTLKIELPNYSSGPLIHEIAIPVVQPQAVIEAQYPKNQFSNIPIVLQALPYFFNATSTAPLSFSWSVNGQNVSNAENPQTLQVSLPQSTPSGFSLAVSLNIQNSTDLSSAQDNVNLAYQP